MNIKGYEEPDGNPNRFKRWDITFEDFDSEDYTNYTKGGNNVFYMPSEDGKYSFNTKNKKKDLREGE